MARRLPFGMTASRGYTRLVLCVGPWAVKIPRIRRPRIGLECNREEIRVSRETALGICPVLWSGLWGAVVVMPRCRILTHEEWQSEGLDSEAAEMFYDDSKPDNFGYYRGAVVLVDYGGAA